MNYFNRPRNSLETDFAFSSSELDRNAIRRSDKSWYESLKHSNNSRFTLFYEKKVVISDDGNSQRAFFTRAEAEEFNPDWDNSPYLGSRAGLDFFCTTIANFDEEALATRNFQLIGLRALAIESTISGQELSVLAQAAALNHWHTTHQFCAVCGHKTYLAEAGYRRDCIRCGSEHFPRTDPAVIMLVISNDNCLLGSTARFAAGMYSTLAGFVEPGETIEDAVRREVFEESGIKVGRVEYQYSQPWPFPANIMIGCFAEALSTEITINTDELIDCRWFSKTEINLMSINRHPEKFFIPPNISIASALIHHWNNLES